MTFRSRLFWLFTLFVLAAVALVTAGVTLTTRRAFADLDAHRAAAEILQPRKLYERQGRLAEYDGMVARLKRERAEYLGSFAGLDDAITKSIS